MINGAMISAFLKLLKQGGDKLADVAQERAEQRRIELIRRRELQRQQILPIARKHKAVLSEKMTNLLACDDYGVIDSSRWKAELRYFTERVIEPQLGEEVLFSPEELRDIIEDVL